MIEHACWARMRALALFSTIAAVPLSGCDAMGDGDGDGHGNGNGPGGGEAEGEAGGDEDASASEQQRCKDACNQLKFFDCNDAADHAQCFESCEQAPSAAIEVFVACVENDICDPECAANLHGQSNGEESGGSTAGEASCPDACEEYVAAGCFPAVDCVAACATFTELEQAFVVYCVERRSGCELPEECADALPDAGG